MTKTMKSNEETVKLSAQLLKENTKWKVVYSEYAEAIKKNDPDKAKRMIRKHLINSYKRTLNKIFNDKDIL